MKHGVMLAAAVLAIVGCGGIDQTEPAQETDRSAINEAYAVIDGLYDNEASDDEKLEASVEFLERYPESEHTVQLIGDIFYFMGDLGHDVEGAVAFAEKIRGRVSDPEIGADFDRRLITWYGDAGMKDKMLAVATSLEDQGIVRFGDYFRVIESAVAMEQWELAREYCAKASPMANAAVWRAEWPDVEATDEEAQRAGLNRQGMLLVNDSWATANLGELDDALAGFAQAGEALNPSYLGIPGENLNLYWGRTLMMSGDPAGAMTRLAPDALICGDESAKTELENAYVQAYGSADGLAEWSCLKRLEIAKTADDFELPDLDGARHRFADLRSEVTLLNFWSPT